MARAGEGAIPVEPAPRPLRRFLQFARLPDRALEVTRRVLDDDPEFRSRVLGAVTEDDVGRGGWLFLARPEGWEDELAVLEETAAEDQLHAHDVSEEREARRRLHGAEDARQRAEAALAVARADIERLSAELAREREARQRAEEAAATAAESARKLTSEAGSSRATAARAQELRAGLEAEVTRLQAEVDDLSEQLGAARELVVSEEQAPAPTPPTPPTADVHSTAVRAAVADAAAAAARLGEALAAAAAALGGEPGAPPTPAAEGAELDPESSAGAADVRAVRSRQAAGPVRVPAALPPATFHDSPAAAEHLVRLNGVVVFVDGYNVSKLKWPELPIADQRQRLVDALGGLAARTGADVHAVFDGAEQTEAQPPVGPRRLVRVTFSPPGVEADDVVIAMVDTVPLHRPCVVVSSDRRVRDGAACRGANTISSDQLLALL